MAAEPVAESVAGFVAGFVAGCLKAASIPRPPMTPIPFVITLIRSSVPKSGKSSGSIGIGSTGARKWIAPPPPSLSLGKEGRSTLLADGSDVHSRSVSGAGGEEETPPSGEPLECGEMLAPARSEVECERRQASFKPLSAECGKKEPPARFKWEGRGG